MLTTLEAIGTAADVTAAIIPTLHNSLSDSALTLFRMLHTAAVEVGAARDYHPSVTQVSFFCPVEAVALALGCHRSTVYRSLSELRAAGLVDCRGHYTTLRGQTRSDGSVWAVRLRVASGCRVRLGYGDLKRQYRNLSGDIEAGKTVWAAMRQSKEISMKAGLGLKAILCWALPQTEKTPVTLDCRTARRADLEAVLDVLYASTARRSAAVDLGAQALATALQDSDGVMFYRRLLWQLLRRADATGDDYSYSVYLAAQRARTDALEGFARKPGALFVSRLKKAVWWEEITNAPPNRVGVKPVQA